MFLSSTIFEERHLIVIQLISYLFPEVAFKKISGFRPGLSSRAWGFVCRKLIRECAGKKIPGRDGERRMEEKEELSCSEARI